MPTPAQHTTPTTHVFMTPQVREVRRSGLGDRANALIDEEYRARLGAVLAAQRDGRFFDDA